MELREFSAEHIEEALDLWKRTEHIGLSESDEPPALAAFLERNPGLSFAAFRGEALVGTILCGQDGRRGYIHHLAVAAEARRMGLGSRLIDASLATLRAQGIIKCHAFVFRDNPHGERFWAPAGWTRRDDLFTYSTMVST